MTAYSSAINYIRCYGPGLLYWLLYSDIWIQPECQSEWI